jgi:hypothetical protein
MFGIRSTWFNSNGFGERDRPDLEISRRDDHRSKNEPIRPRFERDRRVSRCLSRLCPDDDGDANDSLTEFAARAAAPLAACGVAVGAAWLVWVLGVPWVKRSGNSWPSSRRNYGERLSANAVRCRATHERNWMDDREVEELAPYAQCLEGFLLWVSPFVCAMARVRPSL